MIESALLLVFGVSLNLEHGRLHVVSTQKQNAYAPYQSVRTSELTEDDLGFAEFIFATDSLTALKNISETDDADGDSP